MLFQMLNAQFAYGEEFAVRNFVTSDHSDHSMALQVVLPHDITSDDMHDDVTLRLKVKINIL